MPQKLGYNTNGFPHHRLADTLAILAEIGYRSVALTLDVHTLNPFAEDIHEQTSELRRRLQTHGLTCVIETGGRYLLDPRRKHHPTLVSADPDDRARRLDLLIRAIRIAAELDAEAVSFWSGATDESSALSQQSAAQSPRPHAASNVLPRADADSTDAPPADPPEWDRLTDACDTLLTHAVRNDVRLAFEPEPGMFIQTMNDYAHLAAQLHHPRFGLTLDLGHLHCLADGDPADRIRQFRDHLFNIHIEDMRRETHEHLMFGDGEMQFKPIFAALNEIGYSGAVNVELPRHGRDAPRVARAAYDFLSKLNR